jgi:hypothetical protein
MMAKVRSSGLGAAQRSYRYEKNPSSEGGVALTFAGGPAGRCFLTNAGLTLPGAGPAV